MQAFAALLDDGSVRTWGTRHCGEDSSEMQDQLRNVQQAHSIFDAFAAILADGSAATWGCQLGGDSTDVERLKHVKSRGHVRQLVA